MLATIIEIFVKSAIMLGLPLSSIAIIVWAERRGAAFIQRRLGPNRVGPFGLIQGVADVVKFLFKEEVVPAHVKPIFYHLAPFLSLLMAILPLAGLPLCEPFYIGADKIYPEVFRSGLGIFYVFAATSLGSYGVLLAGWASNNKYSMLGSIRACAQMISYEISMTVVIVSLLFIYGSFDFHIIVQKQAGAFFGLIPKWGVFYQPLGALVFLIGIFAESNRVPFDLGEAESELVAGFHTEYSAIKFALFFMGEYLHMIILSTLFILLYLGGYNLLPGMSFIVEKIPMSLYVLQALSLIIKIACMVWFFIWVRWSLPRVRYDQLMSLGWKRLFTLGLLNLIVTVVVVYFFEIN